MADLTDFLSVADIVNSALSLAHSAECEPDNVRAALPAIRMMATRQRESGKAGPMLLAIADILEKATSETPKLGGKKKG